MSQPSIVRTEPLNSNAPVRPQSPAARCGTLLRPSERVLRNLCLVLVLVCAASACASAQQAPQAVKSSEPVMCGAKPHELRLVRVEAPINDTNAKALGVVLTPEGAGDSKEFFLYWLTDQTTSPTHRDNTSGGNLGRALLPYGDGRVAKDVPVVESFFSEAKCSPDNPQVVGIQRALNNLSFAPANLRELAKDLKYRRVQVDEGQIQDASPADQALFNGLKNEMDFARAARKYVSSLFVTEGRLEDADGNRGSNQGSGKGGDAWAEEKQELLAQIETLKGQVKEPNDQKASLFGGTPLWLLITFPLAGMVVGALIVVGVAAYRVRSKPTGNKHSGDTTEGAETNTEGPGEQASQISNNLRAVIEEANKRRRIIEEKWAQKGQADVVQSQKNLMDSIFSQLRDFLSINHLHKATRIIGKELDKAKDIASPYEWRAVQLDKAYTELQSHLEALQQGLPDAKSEATVDAPPAPSSPNTTESVEPPSAEPPADVYEMKETVVHEMKEKFNQLVEDIGAMKSTVDGFDITLNHYFGANKGLQSIASRWYGPNYSGGETDDLVSRVGEVIDLYRFLSKECRIEIPTVARTKDCLQKTLSKLIYIRDTHLKDKLDRNALPYQIADEAELRLYANAQLVRDYKEIRKSLREHVGGGLKAIEAVATLIEERETAQKKLGKYHPNLNFIQIVDKTADDYDAFAGEINRALPDTQMSTREAVASLANKYLELKPEADRASELDIERDNLKEQLATAQGESKAGKELAEEIARQLNFKTDGFEEATDTVTETLALLKREGDPSTYLQLRLGLSSALLALGKATDARGSDEQAEVIEALFLENVKEGIKDLLAAMGGYSAEQLWNEGIYQGFSERWLNYLIRADLLLSTYYARRKEFGPLRKAVSLACSSLLTTLYEFHVEVAEVGLFEKLPKDIATTPVEPRLRNLQAVIDKVLLQIKIFEDTNVDLNVNPVAVDVTSFPYIVKGDLHNKGCVSQLNPSAWMQR